MNELNGFVERMDFETYKAVPALNPSSLVLMRRSPMYYRYMVDNPQPPTEAMKLGTATHRLILEPDRVGDFAVWGLLEEEKVRRGKVWDNFQEVNKGAEMIVTVAERDAMVGMATGARKNVPIRKYADMKGRAEVSMFWRDERTGRRYKGRVDKICEGNVIADLKTCVSCQPYFFSKASFRLGYHIKLAMYWSGYKALTGHEPKLKILAIEKKPPHESVVYRITKDVLTQGLEEWQELEKKLVECEDSNLWPAEYETETDLPLPQWLGEEADADFEAETAEAEV